jgi:pyrroline-5-carboxylate reductase
MTGQGIGFIGTGVLASSMIRGICSSEALSHTKIVTSPRNAAVAAELAAAFENVTVASSNQEVLDACDWAVISVTPKIGEAVVRALDFRPDHTVISLLATKRLDTVKSWMRPVARMFRMVPMPFIARRVGPITLFPAARDMEEFFGRLGRVIAVDEEPQVELTNAITSVTNATYTVIQTVADWGAKNGLRPDTSRDYAIAYFEAMLSQISGERAVNLPRFVEERTPEGVNDAVMKMMAPRGGFALWSEALDAAIEKIRADYL